MRSRLGKSSKECRTLQWVEQKGTFPKEGKRQGQMPGAQTGGEASRFGNKVVTVTLNGTISVKKRARQPRAQGGCTGSGGVMYSAGQERKGRRSQRVRAR